MNAETLDTQSTPKQSGTALGIKNAFVSFYMPIRWLWPVLISVVAFIEVTRIPWGLGYDYNILMLFITLALFYYAFSRLHHVATAGVRPRTHAFGGLIFGIGWAVTISIANTLSATAAYLRDYYYYSTDSFFVQVAGMRELVDTNGEPYIVPDGALTLAQFGINFAIHLSCLAGIVALGALLGAMHARWNGLVVLIFLALSGIVAFQVSWWMYNSGIRIAAPVPGVFLFMIPLAIIAALATAAIALTAMPTHRANK